MNSSGQIHNMCLSPVYRWKLFVYFRKCIMWKLEAVVLSGRWLRYIPKCCALSFNTLRPRQSGRHFADDIFKCIFLNENVWIPIKISLKFVPKAPINNIPALVKIMAWCRPGDKPLSEPMMVSLLTHICVTRPQRVNVMMYCTDA